MQYGTFKHLLFRILVNLVNLSLLLKPISADDFPKKGFTVQVQILLQVTLHSRLTLELHCFSRSMSNILNYPVLDTEFGTRNWPTLASVLEKGTD